jgi:hypothetical protein
LTHFALASTAHVDSCRAMGASSCVIVVTLDAVRPAEETAAAA